MDVVQESCGCNDWGKIWLCKIQNQESQDLNLTLIISCCPVRMSASTFHNNTRDYLDKNDVYPDAFVPEVKKFLLSRILDFGRALIVSYSQAVLSYQQELGAGPLSLILD